MTGVIGIIQARLGSSRLPGKILAPIAGRPLLAVLIERLRSARVDEWWLATTAEPDDDVTAAWGEALGVRVHRGAVNDVLSRTNPSTGATCSRGSAATQHPTPCPRPRVGRSARNGAGPSTHRGILK